MSSSQVPEEEGQKEEVKSFNRERFLFLMLAGIFTWQAAIFSYGVFSCYKTGGLKACPELGRRYESTVNVMVATTLALLTGGAVVGVTQRRPSSSGDRDVSVSPPQPSQSPRPGGRGQK